MEHEIPLQEKQILFQQAIEEYPVTLFGGARGGGKSYALRNIFLVNCFDFPGTTAAIFRKTFPELDANHIRPLFQEHPFLRTFWNESKKLLAFPNGSSFQFSHCKNEVDVHLYQGREISLLGIDECGGWTESMFRTLQGSNRSSRPGVKSRIALTANPGGVGHAWLKRLFIERRFNERERPDDYHFIQSLVNDNPALIETDPDYVHRLNAEPNEALRRAFLYGDWNVIAGAYFSEMRREVHFIKPFEIPKHWKRFGAYDYGYNHPAAFGWFACDEDGNVFMYREMVQAKMRVDQFAAAVKEFPDTQDLEYIVAGLDCWNDKGISSASNSAPTIAEEFNKAGIFLSKANIGRIQGAAHLRSYLSWAESDPPRLKIFSTCPITFDCLTRMEHDPNRIEDVLKVDAVEGDPMTGDDPYDMVRYALMSRPPVADRLKPKHKVGSDAWGKQEAKIMEDQALEQFNKQKDIESGLSFGDDPWSKGLSTFDNDW